MRADLGAPINRLRVDGGAAANNFLMQFQADISAIDVERPSQIETTGLGAAYLAGITTGVWQDVDELEANRQIDRVFSPQMQSTQRQEKLAHWQDTIQRLSTDVHGE